MFNIRLFCQKGTILDLNCDVFLQNALHIQWDTPVHGTNDDTIQNVLMRKRSILTYLKLQEFYKKVLRRLPDRQWIDIDTINHIKDGAKKTESTVGEKKRLKDKTMRRKSNKMKDLSKLGIGKIKGGRFCYVGKMFRGMLMPTTFGAYLCQKTLGNEYFYY